MSVADLRNMCTEICTHLLRAAARCAEYAEQARVQHAEQIELLKKIEANTRPKK